MSMSMIQVTDQECATRQLMEVQPGEEWYVIAIKRTFIAMWRNALPVERVRQVAEALSGLPIEEAHVQAALTRMTRDKLLRSRVQQGKRLYEVNY